MREWNGVHYGEVVLAKPIMDQYVRYRDVFREVDSRAEIPPLHFKPEWDVRIRPPFGGAMMRFTVDYNGKHISVYCDFFEMLGCFDGGPYWEMYPRSYADGSSDTMRFALADAESLIENIDAELRGEAAQ